MSKVETLSEVFGDKGRLVEAYKMSGLKQIRGDHGTHQIQPISAPVFGGNYTSLKIGTSGNRFLRDARIVTTIGAASKTGGTYVRGVNALGIYMWNRFELWCGGKQVETKDADAIFYQLFYMASSTKWTRIAADIAYDTSTSNRNTLASAAQVFSLALKWIFDFFQHDVDLNIYKELEIRCYPQTSVQFCLQTDGTSPTFSITETYLDCDMVQPVNEIAKLSRELYFAQSTPKVFSHETIYKDFALASGATSAQLQFDEIQGKYITEILILVRANTLLRTALTSDYTDSNTALTSWNIQANGKYINDYQKNITVDYYRRVILPRIDLPNINNLTTRNEYVISFSEGYSQESDSRKTFVGYQIMPRINIMVNLVMSALGANSTCTLIARCVKIMSNEGGDIVNINQ